MGLGRRFICHFTVFVSFAFEGRVSKGTNRNLTLCRKTWEQIEILQYDEQRTWGQIEILQCDERIAFGGQVWVISQMCDGTWGQIENLQCDEQGTNRKFTV